MHLVLLSESILLSAAKTRKSLKICSNVPPVYRPLKGRVQKYQGERGGRKVGVFSSSVCVITAELILALIPDNFVRFSQKILVSAKNICCLKAVELITGFKQDSWTHHQIKRDQVYLACLP